MRYAIWALISLFFGAPAYAGSLTSENISTAGLTNVSASLFGPGAGGIALNAGTFFVEPFLPRPGDTVHVLLSLSSYAFGSDFFTFPNTYLNSSAGFSVLLPFDTSGDVTLSGVASGTGSITVTELHSVESYEFTGTGTGIITLESQSCPDGPCYFPRSASVSLTAVPEPSTWLLLAFGLIGFMVWRRRWRSGVASRDRVITGASGYSPSGWRTRYLAVLLMCLLLATPAWADSTLIFAVSNPIDMMGGIVNHVGQVAFVYTNIFFDQMHLYISSAAGQPVTVTELAVHDFRAPGRLSIVSLDDAGTLTYLYQPSLFDGGPPDAPVQTITRTFDPGPLAVRGNYGLTVENNAVCCGHSLYRLDESVTSTPVPESSTWLLMASGMIGFMVWRWTSDRFTKLHLRPGLKMRYIILVLTLLVPVIAHAVPVEMGSPASAVPLGLDLVLPAPTASVAPIPFTIGTLSGTMAYDAFFSTTSSGLTGSSFLWTIAMAATPTDQTLKSVSFSNFGRGPSYDLDYLLAGTSNPPVLVTMSNGPEADWGDAGLGAGDTASLFLQTDLLGFGPFVGVTRLSPDNAFGFDDTFIFGVGFVPVPEPSSLALLCLIVLPIMMRHIGSGSTP